MVAYSLRDAAVLLGQSYSRTWHAIAYGRVPRPSRVGHTFVLNEQDVDALRDYFLAGSRGNDAGGDVIDPLTAVLGFETESGVSNE